MAMIITTAAEVPVQVIDRPAQVTIRAVSFREILNAPNAAELLRAYAEESLFPDPVPQQAVYAVLEQAHVLKCFGAYSGSTNLLIGFISVLVAVMPHHGRLIATSESLFVDPAYRSAGVGNLLLTAGEQHAIKFGCEAFMCLARIGGSFEKLLARRDGYHPTHEQHTKWLGGRS